MKSFELFEAIGNLPLETIEIKESRKIHRTFLPYAAALLAIVIFIRGGIFIYNYLSSPNAYEPPTTSPGMYDQLVPPADNSGNTTNHAAAFGPVTIFGLAPAEQGTASLVSENITFSKDTTQTGEMYGLYPAEMRYTVELTDTASFVLPHAYIKNHGQADELPEIYVDGRLITFHVDRHPSADASVPMLFEGSKRQSVFIYPDHWDEDVQPANTYQLLMQAWKAEPVSPFPDVPLSQLIGASGGWVNMYTFDIEGAGTHEIVIKLVAIGDDILCDNYMLEWAASPSNMWSEAGERNLAVVIEDNQYQYAMQDDLFHFEQSKEREEETFETIPFDPKNPST